MRPQSFKIRAIIGCNVFIYHFKHGEVATLTSSLSCTGGEMSQFQGAGYFTNDILAPPVRVDGRPHPRPPREPPNVTPWTPSRATKCHKVQTTTKTLNAENDRDPGDLFRNLVKVRFSTASVQRRVGWTLVCRHNAQSTSSLPTCMHHERYRQISSYPFSNHRWPDGIFSMCFLHHAFDTCRMR